jgi:hypothetical protein
MKKITLFFGIVLLLVSCDQKTKKSVAKNIEIPKLNIKSANYLYEFAYQCIDKEYPNKLGQVLGNASYLKEPSELHPSFYGCFDWHSSVHGHWTLLTICEALPNFTQKDSILSKIKKNITKKNILKEVSFFNDHYNKNFERTYGWAWLLKVAETLRDSNTKESIELYTNMKPLVVLIENKYIEFLNKLNYPIRIGEHSNTAFGLSFALDYAKKYSPKLKEVIIKKAKTYYLKDKNGPISWEPGGFDFLSPCLQEASLMLKVLPKDEFIKWLDAFLPDFRKHPSKYLQIGEVTDRSDGKLAHLDGLNFSRAWCLFEIGKALQNDKIIQLGNQHFNYSYSKMNTKEYAGAHWLASFALYAMIES